MLLSNKVDLLYTWRPIAMLEHVRELFRVYVYQLRAGEMIQQCSLLFQRTQVPFPAPTPGGSQLPVAPAPGTAS